MAPHYKRKHSRLLLPVVLTITILSLVAVVLIYLSKNQLTGGDTTSDTGSISSLNSADPSSEISSDLSSLPIESVPAESDEIESSTPPSSTPPSSTPPSSTPPSSTPPSSTPPSSTPPSSAQTSSVPPSSTPKQEDVPTSSVDIPSSPENTPPVVNGTIPAGQLTDWNLILLNPDENNRIESELNIEKTKFDTQYVDSRAADAYKKMCSAALDGGSTLYLRSGYRSMKTQQVNYNSNVQRLIKAGNSKDESIRLTNQYYTVPGHSEHHSGLAFDIITPQYHKNVYTLDERFAQTEAYTWLIQNSADYGFILRYPKDKKSITTINFEPWHYRYVGVEHAKYITDNGLCLEEYIELLKQAGR